MYVPRLRRIETVLKEIKQTDPQSVISRWFIIQLIRSEEITQLKYGDAWLINTDELYGYLSGNIPQDFEEKVNPRHINERVKIPRLRWHDDSVRNFKRTHPELIGATITIAEQAFHSDKVFKTLNGHRWIINYDQLEQEVIRIINAKQPPK